MDLQDTMSFVDWTPNGFAMDFLDTILATHNQTRPSWPKTLGLTMELQWIYSNPYLQPRIKKISIGLPRKPTKFVDSHWTCYGCIVVFHYCNP